MCVAILQLIHQSTSLIYMSIVYSLYVIIWIQNSPPRTKSVFLHPSFNVHALHHVLKAQVVVEAIQQLLQGQGAAPIVVHAIAQHGQFHHVLPKNGHGHLTLNGI